jgi:hypothetical protein
MQLIAKSAKSTLLATLLLSQFPDGPYSLYLNPVPRFGPQAVMRALDFREAKVICAHQYIAELEDELREAIFGLVPTTVAFRLGPTDAERLGKLFPPDQIRRDIADLPPYVAHARTPYQTYADLHMPRTEARRYPKAIKEVVTRARRRYALQRKQVEAILDERYGD